MNLEKSVFVPKNSYVSDRRVSLVTAIISVLGIVFFDWHVAQVIFLFFADILFIGFATLLKMLFARGLLNGLLGKLVFGVGFVVLYGGLFMILVSFALTNLNTEEFVNQLAGLRYGVWFLGLNHFAGFLFGFIYSDEYRKTTMIAQLFSTMFYVLPLVTVLVMLVFPNSNFFGPEFQNQWMAIGIILLRFVFDLVSNYLKDKASFT